MVLESVSLRNDSVAVIKHLRKYPPYKLRKQQTLTLNHVGIDPCIDPQTSAVIPDPFAHPLRRILPLPNTLAGANCFDNSVDDKR